MNGGEAERSAAVVAHAVFGLAIGSSSWGHPRRTGRTDREAFPVRGDPA